MYLANTDPNTFRSVRRPSDAATRGSTRSQIGRSRRLRSAVVDGGYRLPAEVDDVVREVARRELRRGVPAPALRLDLVVAVGRDLPGVDAGVVEVIDVLVAHRPVLVDVDVVEHEVGRLGEAAGVRARDRRLRGDEVGIEPRLLADLAARGLVRELVAVDVPAGR